MINLRGTFIALVFLSFCVGSLAAQRNFKFGYVKNGDGVDSVWLATTPKKNRIQGRTILSHGNTFSPRINIDGRDIELKSVRSSLPDQNFKVGRGGYEIFRGKDIRLRLDYVFTWMCPPEQENCSVYYYRGVLDVTYKGQRRKVNIFGFGGS